MKLKNSVTIKYTLQQPNLYGSCNNSNTSAPVYAKSCNTVSLILSAACIIFSKRIIHSLISQPAIIFYSNRTFHLGEIVATFAFPLSCQVILYFLLSHFSCYELISQTSFSEKPLVSNLNSSVWSYPT